MAGAAFSLCVLLGIKHGVTFSQGLIEYLLLFPRSANALWLLALGPLWACMYFWVFDRAIKRWDLSTPGRGGAA